MDEIQLLNETEIKYQHQISSDNNNSDGESENKKAKLGINDDVKLDEISLAKSIEDLRRLTSEPRNSFISSEVNIVQSIEHHSGVQQQNDDADIHIKMNQRPLSTATNCSVEITEYQVAIEDVLEKLLKAEDAISANDNEPVPNSLVDSRKQFQNHEEFMLKLAEYQVSVGSALEEGTLINFINTFYSNDFSL